MADNFNFSDLQSFLNEFVKKNQEAHTSLKGYLKTQKDLLNLERELTISKKAYATLTKEIGKYTDSNGKKLTNLTSDEKKRLKFLKAHLKTQQSTTEELNKQVLALKQATKASNLMIASVNSVGRGIKMGAKGLLDQKDYLLEGIKAVRVSEKSMGLLKTQTDGYRNNLYLASLHTADLGIELKDLAKIQTSYSDQLERNVFLSQKQMVSVSEIASATNMSVEAAGAFVGKMDMFGSSVEKTAGIVGDITNSSAKMGLNSTKVLGKLEGSLKMANKYHFKGGVKGMGQMAQMAAKFKVEMDSIGGMADKLFDPEGAIEMAAQLQVLGGAWSQIADPFTLMYKARNDMAGLQKDVIKAASGVAVFNKQTGEFEISALELHRMRSAAEMTGISMDELAESAKSVAKFSKVKAQIRGIVDPDLKEFIATTANLDNGIGKIQIGSDNFDVKNLSPQNIKKLKDIMEDKSTLKDKIKNAQTFDEKYDNLITKGKSALFPIMEAIDKVLSKPLEQFTEWLKKPEVIDNIVKTISTISTGIIDVATWIGDAFTKSPLATSLTVLATGGLAMGISKMWDFAQWFSNGQALAAGFNAAASVGGGDSGSDILDSLGGKGKKGAKFGRMRKAAKYGKMAKGWGGAGAGLLAAGISGYDEWSTNSENGMSGGENAGRTATRAGAAGGGAWGGAALGATIGTAIFPGVGTAIGGVIGGLAGGFLGDKVGDAGGDAIFGKTGPKAKKQDDFIARPGADPISFNSADTLMGVKKDGGLGKALLGKSGGGTSSSESVVVTFDRPLVINGKIELSGFGQSTQIDLNNPLIIRELTKLIQVQLSKNLAGGKISSNPN